MQNNKKQVARGVIKNDVFVLDEDENPVLIILYLSMYYSCIYNFAAAILAGVRIIKKRIWFLISLLTFISGVWETSYAQVNLMDHRYVVDSWGIEEGLPVNNVVRLLQSEQGYLWFTTYDGLVRFDGLQFKIYQTEEYPGLPSNRLINLHEAPDGSLWMETEQQFLVKLQDGAFHHMREEDGLNGEINFGTHQDYRGDLWFALDEGISVYKNGKLTPFHPDRITGSVDRIFLQKDDTVWLRQRESGQVYRFYNGKLEHSFSDHMQNFLPFYEDETGRLWIGSGTDIYYFENESLHLYTSLEPEAREAISISSDTDGVIWIFSYNNGFYQLQNGEAVHFGDSEGEIYSFSKSFHLDNQEQFWMFSHQGVWHNQQKVLEVENGISSHLFDLEGNIWIGTTNDGLIRIKPNPFVIYSAEEGLPERNVYPVLEDRDGTIWVGTHGGGVAKIKNGAVKNVEILRDEHRSYVNSLYETSGGTIYASLLGGGLYQKSPGETVFRKAKDLPPYEGDMYAMHEDEDGNLWLGTNFGLILLKDGEQYLFDQQWGFTNHPVRYFLQAPDGSLWMATNGAGIARYYEGELEIFDRESGFESNLVRSLHISPESIPEQYILWAGTEDRGLIRLEIENHTPDLQNSTTYNRQAGMLDYVIHKILEDETGHLWFNTNRGIFYTSLDQLDKYHRGEISEIRGIAFNESDGLRNREGNGGMQSAGVKASDGRFWLPGQDGVAVVDPAGQATNEKIPAVIIEELESGQRLIPNHHSTTKLLHKDERDFELRFTALSFTASENNRFRYRLSGYNDNWIEAETRRNAVYTNIPAGEYTFEVMGSNNSGKWNPEPASLEISIAPYFYETAWFQFLIVGLLGLVFVAGVQWRVRALKKREADLKQLVDERTEQLQIEKQMTQKQADSLKELDNAKTRFFTNISHEFRTPLTLIMGPLQRMLSSEKDKFDGATQREFQRMLRNSDRLLRLIDQTLELTRIEHGKIKLSVVKIDLNRFIERLSELFEPICSEKNIELTFQPSQSEIVLYADPDKLDMMVANLLSNAIKFTPSGGSVKIEIKSISDSIGIEVTDSGVGISDAEIDNIFDRFYQVDSTETRTQEGSGIGLSLVHEFAALHKGELFVESEKGAGSTFTLKFKKGTGHFSNEVLADTGNHSFLYDRYVKDTDGSDFSGQHSSHYQAEPVNLPGKADDRPDTDDQTTILVVEDNQGLRSYISGELRTSYRVIEAENGLDALGKVKTDLPDLVIADIMMPEMDGVTFNRKLKKNAETASIPVIFLTAKASKENVLTGLNEGADDYLTKPFDPQILQARVHNLIESRFRIRNLLLKNDVPKKELTENESPTDPFLEKVIRIISENYTDPDFNVTRLSEKLYLDRSQVLRKMKERAGITPGEQIKKIRMEKAKSLLVEKAGTISEIAYGTGFKSLSYFSYVFKKYYGVPPSNFL